MIRFLIMLLVPIILQFGCSDSSSESNVSSEVSVMPQEDYSKFSKVEDKIAYSISAAQETYNLGKKIFVRVSVKNITDKDIQILCWHHPFEALIGASQKVHAQVFEITQDDELVAYTVKAWNRNSFSSGDYWTIPAGMTVSIDLDLSASYDFKKAGEYKIKYLGKTFFEEGKPSVCPANEITIKVNPESDKQQEDSLILGYKEKNFKFQYFRKYNNPATKYIVQISNNKTREQEGFKGFYARNTLYHRWWMCSLSEYSSTVDQRGGKVIHVDNTKVINWRERERLNDNFEGMPSKKSYRAETYKTSSASWEIIPKKATVNLVNASRFFIVTRKLGNAFFRLRSSRDVGKNILASARKILSYDTRHIIERETILPLKLKLSKNVPERLHWKHLKFGFSLVKDKEKYYIDGFTKRNVMPVMIHFEMEKQHYEELRKYFYYFSNNPEQSSLEQMKMQAMLLIDEASKGVYPLDYFLVE